MKRKTKQVSYSVLPVILPKGLQGKVGPRWTITRIEREHIATCRDPEWAGRIANALTDEEEYVGRYV